RNLELLLAFPLTRRTQQLLPLALPTKSMRLAGSLVIGGCKIDVRGSALDGLPRMGAHDAVVEASTRVAGALLVDREGAVINELSGDQFGHRVGGDLEIVRGDLCQILMDRASGVEVIFDDVIEAIT